MVDLLIKSLRAAILLGSVVFASGLIGSEVKGQQTEYWNSSEGELQLVKQGSRVYRGTFNGNELLGTRSGRGDFLGHWINSRQNTPRCSYPIKNSFYWGTVRLSFSSDRFRGTFGVCDFPPGANWNGSLKMVGSGGSGLDLTGFFQPAYVKRFVTEYGVLTFQKTRGQYDKGQYGNGYGTITLGATYWRPDPRKEQEVHGRFVNREGGRGQFILNFESECVFSGEYWYDGQASKYPWHGICHSGRSRPSGRVSCKAINATCNAQAAGLLVEEYCVKNPTMYGCPFKRRR